jgi:hypothetical protein
VPRQGRRSRLDQLTSGGGRRGQEECDSTGRRAPRSGPLHADDRRSYVQRTRLRTAAASTALSQKVIGFGREHSARRRGVPPRDVPGRAAESAARDELPAWGTAICGVDECS